MDLRRTAAAWHPEPLAFVCWAALSLQDKDGGNQLVLQVLGQLQDGLDQGEPAVLREDRFDKMVPK